MTNRKAVFATVFGIGLACGLGVVFVFSNAAANAKAKLAQEKAAARAVGMPIEPSDLGLAQVPLDKNAAPIYRQLTFLFTHDLRATQAIVGKAAEKGAKPADQALPELKRVFELAAQLDARPQCNFDHDWSNGMAELFPELATLKALTTDLCLKADWQDRHGDWRGALSTMNTAHRVSVDVGADPIFIGMLVQVGCRIIDDTEFEKIVARHTRDAAALAEIARSVQTSSVVPNQRWFLGGEIVCGRTTIRKIQSLQDLQSDERTPSSLEKSLFNSAFVKDTLETKFIEAWRSGWVSFPKDSDD